MYTESWIKFQYLCFPPPPQKKTPKNTKTKTKNTKKKPPKPKKKPNYVSM